MTNEKKDGYATPLAILLNNAKGQRDAAKAFRADAERAMQRAVEHDRKAEEWEAAAQTLKENGHV